MICPRCRRMHGDPPRKRDYRCKECRRAHWREYARAHAEKYRAYMIEYRKAKKAEREQVKADVATIDRTPTGMRGTWVGRGIE